MTRANNRTMEIRLGTTEDTDAIRTLTRAAYAKWVALIGREPLPMSANYQTAVTQHRFDLLFVDETLAALIETVGETGHLLIKNLAVSPDFQGNGLGTTLITHIEKFAVSAGYPVIKLYTNKLFAGNVPFYEKLGYLVEREEEFMGGMTIHMSKHI